MSSWKLQLMDYSGESNLPRKSLVLVIIMLLSVWLPVPAVSGAIQIEDRDFGVLGELYNALDTRSELLIDDGEADLAANSMASVDSSVRNSTSSDALGAADDPIPDATWKNITIEPVQHPSPYEIILDPSSAPPGATDSILNTLINITDYVIWTQYETTDGQVVDKFEVIDFSASLLSLFPPLPGQPTPDPFLHEIDIDNLLNDGSNSSLEHNCDFFFFNPPSLAISGSIDGLLVLLLTSTRIASAIPPLFPKVASCMAKSFAFRFDPLII